LPPEQLRVQEVVFRTSEGEHKLSSLARIREWLSRFALIVLGILSAVLLAEGLFRLFPTLRPAGRLSSVDLGIIRFTVGMGDIFYVRPGVVAPPSDPDIVLSQHRLSWDADGFRIPTHPSQQYAMLALGDSYTEAANVGMPWPDVVAARRGWTVRNLGFRGYGPVEEGHVLKEYGTKSSASIVIVGYFEGNDLNDVLSSKEEQFILPGIARKAITPYDADKAMWQTDKSGPFQYPVRIKINGVIQELAFLDDHLSWLNGEYEAYARSKNLDELGKAWDVMTKAAPDMCLIIAYFPSAPHIYAPYVMPNDRPRVMSTLAEMRIGAPGAPLGSEKMSPGSTYDTVMRRLNNQRDAVAALAARKGIPFIDLTPVFQAAAGRGTILYYAYDTHWNQAGHDLAGQEIANFLVQHPNPC
jgi:hypothetical protein